MSTPQNPDSSIPLRADESSFTLKDAVEHTWFRTKMKMYILNEDKLNNLTASLDSTALFFFGLCTGAAVSLGIAFSETSSDKVRPYYFGAFLVCFLLGIFFGIRALGDHRAQKNKIKKLYEESTPLDFVPAKNNPTPPS